MLSARSVSAWNMFSSLLKAVHSAPETSAVVCECFKITGFKSNLQQQTAVTQKRGINKVEHLRGEWCVNVVHVCCLSLRRQNQLMTLSELCSLSHAKHLKNVAFTFLGCYSASSKTR